MCKLGGCMTEGMDNYVDIATYDDDSCAKKGCTDKDYDNGKDPQVTEHV